MTGALAIAIVIGAVIALRIAVSLISAIADTAIDTAGKALGNALKPRAPSVELTPQGSITLTRPAAEIRHQLVSVGALDPSDCSLMTPSGVVVELTIASGPPKLACWWDPGAADKPTRIMADVLRTVRQVDAGAQVVL